MFEYANSPDYIDPAAVSKAAAAATRTTTFAAPAIDEYQRRGLSLSMAPSNSMEGKQLTVLEKIARTLETIEKKEPEATF
jgi:hypothetical protein